MTEAEKFLRLLFPHPFVNERILLWSLKDKKSGWFQNPWTAAAQADGRKDVYIGCGVAPAGLSEKERCPADRIQGIGGVWLDIDHVSVHDKKKRRPPDSASCRAYLDAVEPRPSIILHTGHGLQSWWLFEKFWLFNDDADRQAAADLLQAWQEKFRTLLARDNYDLDSTHDLARVLRIPGTFNGKDKEPTLVTAECFNGEGGVVRRYAVEAFGTLSATPLPAEKSSKKEEKQEWALVDRGAAGGAAGVGVAAVSDDERPPDWDTKRLMPWLAKHLTASRLADIGRFTALMDNDQKTKDTFNHERKDLKDTSLSGYDLALANAAARARWSDQEIASLLVEHRAKHDPGGAKAQRIDYLARQVATARASTAGEAAKEGIDEAATFGVADRQKALDDVSSRLGVKIIRVIKYMTDAPQYEIEAEFTGKSLNGTPPRVTQGKIRLPSVDGLITQSKFRSAIAAATEWLPDGQDAENWKKTARVLLELVEKVEVGPEATDIGLISAWLRDYFQEVPPSDNVDDCAASRSPFNRDGKVYFFTPQFGQWLKIKYREHRSAKEIAIMLRGVGGNSTTVAYGGEGRKRERVKAWRVGLDKINVADDSDDEKPRKDGKNA